MTILRTGSRGSEVEALQLALTRAGLFNGAIDGVFGTVTHDAVISLQVQNELTPDGIVGPLTWEAAAPYLRGYVVHTVAHGDTLWRLGRKYGTTADDIETANPGIDALNLHVGSKLNIPLGFDLVPGNISYSSLLCGYICDGLSVRYPFVRKGSVGRSVMGKPMRLLTIGSGTRQLFFNAAFHANEWITTPVLLKFVEDYSKAYVNGGKIYDFDAYELYSSATLYVAPMINPDGVDLATGALSSGRFFDRAKGFAENYPAVPFPSGWKANINGVDLNLQFPAGWEKAKEIKFSQGFTTPAPRDFVGSAPISQNESRAAYEFTRRHNFRVILAYHTQGEIIYWKYNGFDPEGALQLGEKLSKASGYALENTPYSSGFAGYKDWFIEAYNRPGYTVECGLGSNPLPVSQFNKIYSDNIGLLATALAEQF